jgi:hypothetical protein
MEGQFAWKEILAGACSDAAKVFLRVMIQSICR